MLLLFPPLRPHFHAALRDVGARSPRHRAAAAEVLGSAPDDRRDEAKEALRALLDDPDPTVRGAALASAGRLRDEDALSTVLARFEDGDPSVAQIAIIAAGQIGTERAARALRRALKSDRPAVRFQAVASLAELAPKDVARDLGRLTDDPDAEVRAHLADALGALEDEDAARPLRRLLDDDERGVVRSAAIGLARLGDASGARALIEALDDADRCFEAAWALGELGVEDAVEPLHRLSTRLLTPLAIKAAAGAAMVRLGDERGEAVLKSVLRAFRHDARSYAVGLVGELNLVSLAPELVRLTRRLRGTDPMALAKSLRTLAEDSDLARDALLEMADRQDEAGQAAREVLAERD